MIAAQKSGVKLTAFIDAAQKSEGGGLMRKKASIQSRKHAQHNIVITEIIFIKKVE